MITLGYLLRKTIHMRLGKITIVVLLLMAVIQACSSYDRLGEDGQTLIASKEGLFRGLNMDVSPTAVKQHETAEIFEESEFYLGYQIVEPEKGKHLEIEYSFNNDNMLDFIATFYHLPSEKEAIDLTNSLRQYLTDKYGPSKEDELGWYTWQIKDETGEPGTIEVVLLSDIDNANAEYGVDLEMVKYYDQE